MNDVNEVNEKCDHHPTDKDCYPNMAAANWEHNRSDITFFTWLCPESTQSVGSNNLFNLFLRLSPILSCF